MPLPLRIGFRSLLARPPTMLPRWRPLSEVSRTMMVNPRVSLFMHGGDRSAGSRSDERTISDLRSQNGDAWSLVLVIGTVLVRKVETETPNFKALTGHTEWMTCVAIRVNRVSWWLRRSIEVTVAIRTWGWCIAMIGRKEVGWRSYEFMESRAVTD